MQPHEVEAVLRASGALLEGHFLLASGRHSAQYVEKFRLLEQPHLTSRLCAELAARFRDDDIQCVVGPVTGGIILAFEVARQLGCRAIYAERGKNDEGLDEGFELRRGFQLVPGERVVVVEDIVTTGGSARQVVETVQRAGGEVVGVGVLVDRSGGQSDYGVSRVEALLRLDIATYAADETPQWLLKKYGPAVKPGSSPEATIIASQASE